MRNCLLLFAVFVSIILSTDVAKAQDEYSSDQELSKRLDNIYLKMALEDVEYMDIVRLAGLPKAVQKRIPTSAVSVFSIVRLVDGEIKSFESFLRILRSK